MFQNHIVIIQMQTHSLNVNWDHIQTFSFFFFIFCANNYGIKLLKKKWRFL